MNEIQKNKLYRLVIFTLLVVVGGLINAFLFDDFVVITVTAFLFGGLSAYLTKKIWPDSPTA